MLWFMKYIFESLMLGYELVYEICSCYDCRSGVFCCGSRGRTVTAGLNCAV